VQAGAGEQMEGFWKLGEELRCLDQCMEVLGMGEQGNRKTLRDALVLKDATSAVSRR